MDKFNHGAAAAKIGIIDPDNPGPQITKIGIVIDTIMDNCLKIPGKTEKECEKIKDDQVVEIIKDMCKDDKKCIEGIINGIKDIPSVNNTLFLKFELNLTLIIREQTRTIPQTMN